MIRIFVNRTSIGAGRYLSSAKVEHVAHEITRALRIKKTIDVSLGFADEKFMRKLNRQYRGNDAVTDVLSFPLKESNGVFGEILLCSAQAKRQAEKMGHSVSNELVFLLTHGLLHLFGYDHERTSDAKKMFALQTKILHQLSVDSML